MNHLKSELIRLIEEEKQLEFLLATNRSQQTVLSARIYQQEVMAGGMDTKKTVPMYPEPVIKKKHTVTVADKLGNEMQTHYNGKPTVINFIIDALETLEEPLDIKTIHDYVTEQGKQVSMQGVDYSLRQALKKGIVKKGMEKGKTWWSLNEARVERKKKKQHSKPNYGIGRAIAELVSREPGVVMTPSMILEEVKDDFQQASLQLVDATIKGWIRGGKPGIELKTLGETPAYVFKQPVRL